MPPKTAKTEGAETRKVQKPTLDQLAVAVGCLLDSDSPDDPRCEEATATVRRYYQTSLAAADSGE